MGFAIAISDVTDLIESLMNGVDDTGLSLGIEGYMTDSNGFSNYGLPSGFYISKISSDSNASNSSLEIGNIITEIDGTNVTSIDTLRKVLNKKNHGDKVLLKVKYASKNEYKEKEVTIELK